MTKSNIYTTVIAFPANTTLSSAFYAGDDSISRVRFPPNWAGTSGMQFDAGPVSNSLSRVYDGSVGTALAFLGAADVESTSPSGLVGLSGLIWARLVSPVLQTVGGNVILYRVPIIS